MAERKINPTNDDARRDLPLQTRAAPVSSVDRESRTVEVVWTAGAKVEQRDWVTGERYVEELVVSKKAVRLGRLNNGGPVLDNHFRFDGIASMLAVVERAWIADGKGLARIRFPKAEDDENADKVFRKIADGIISCMSVGYRRLKIEVDKSQDPRIWRVVDWEPYEISFVTVPADPEARVRSEAAPTFKCEFATIASMHSARLTRMRMRNRAAGLAD